MTVEQLNTRLNSELERSGLQASFVRDKSQVLEMSDGFFLELVINNWARLQDASGVAKRLQDAVKNDKERLDYVVRALWEVEEIGDPVIAYGENGSPRTAVQYPVVLRSGEKRIQVGVEVTYLASEHLKELGFRNRNDVKQLIRTYIEKQLRLGGTSYWDPEKYPVVEINSSTASYVAGLKKPEVRH